jgi:hypothetical protein
LGKIEARSNLESMKLPNALLAVVEREKVVDYLLNRAHRYGASKAEFFSRYGFVLEKWELLAQALLEHGQKHDVTNVTETGFGPVTRSTGSCTRQTVGPRGCVRFGNWIGDSLRPG